MKLKNYEQAQYMAGELEKLVWKVEHLASCHGVEFPPGTVHALRRQAAEARKSHVAAPRYRLEQLMQHRQAAMVKYELVHAEDSLEKARRLLMEALGEGPDRLRRALSLNLSTKREWKALARVFKPFLPGLTNQDMEDLRIEAQARIEERSRYRPEDEETKAGRLRPLVDGKTGRWFTQDRVQRLDGRREMRHRIDREKFDVEYLYHAWINDNGQRERHSFSVSLVKDRSTGRARLSVG
jgi:hypothetical protein